MAAATVDVALAVTGLNQSLGAIQTFNRALGTVGRGIGGAVSAVGSALVGIGTVGAVALGAVGAAVGGAGINFLAMKEQAQTAFSTLLGDGAKATAFLAQLQTLAASTPFEFPDLVVGAQRLLAMGFQANQVIPTLTAIGDAVAAMGGGKAEIDRVTLAFGQMQAKGRVQGDEMLQLAEAGIPAWKYLARTLGVDIPTAMKMVTKGQVSSAVGIAAITKGMQKDFGGAMAAQSRTWNGLISSVKDYARIMAGTAIGPAFTRVLKPALEAVAAFMAGPGQKAAERFAGALDRGITRAMRAWADLRDGFGKGLRDLNRMGGQVGFFRQLGKEARAFIDTMRAMRGGAGGLAGLVKALGSRGGTLALGFLLIARSISERVIPAVQLLWRTFAPFTGGEAGSGLATFQRIVLGVAGVVERLARFEQLAVDSIVTFKQALSGEWFPNSAGNAFVNIVGNIGLLLSSLPDIISENKTRFSSFHDIVGENLTRFDGLIARAKELRDILKDLPIPKVPAPVVAGAAGAGALAVANPGAALKVGGAALGGLGTAVSFAISIVGGLIAILGGPLTLAIAALVGLGVLVYKAWEGNWGGIRDKTAAVVAWWQGTAVPAFARGWEVLQGVVNMVAPVLKNIFTYLTGGQVAGGLAGLGAQVQLLASILGTQLGTLAGMAVAKLAQLATAFLTWLTPRLPEFLGMLGRFFVRAVEYLVAVALPAFRTMFLKFAVAFWDWVGPVIPPALAALGTFVITMTNWMRETALPAIRAQLLTWGAAFGTWIAETAVPYLQENLPLWIAALGTWATTIALPFVRTMLSWLGEAFGTWVTAHAIPWLTQTLPGWIATLGTWFTGTALPFVLTKLGDLGKAFGDFIATDAIPWLKLKLPEWIAAFQAWITATAIPWALTALVSVGQNLAAGLADGLLDGLPDWAKHLLGVQRTATVGGTVTGAGANGTRTVGQTVTQGGPGGLGGLGTGTYGGGDYQRTTAATSPLVTVTVPVTIQINTPTTPEIIAELVRVAVPIIKDGVYYALEGALGGPGGGGAPAGLMP